jgi:hypothetical protein
MTADTTSDPLSHPASEVYPGLLFLLPKNARRGRSPRSRTSLPLNQRHASTGATGAPEDRCLAGL